MELPEYVTAEEVRRVCKTLGISDWSVKIKAEVAEDEAAVILDIVNTAKMGIALADFRQGLEVELEHGTRFADANVTNNHPILTGKIVLAHLKETLDYYQRIEVAELEGDLLKAILSGEAAKIKEKYGKLIAARETLEQVMAKQLRKRK